MGFLPAAADDITTVSTAATDMPSKTYRMKIADERIIGMVDDLDAIAQACYKILNTERYRYVIYSWDYGIELQDLFGKPLPYVYSELPRRIEEALLQDDRIESVGNFELSSTRGDVLAKFTVTTVDGDSFDLEKGVTII